MRLKRSDQSRQFLYKETLYIYVVKFIRCVDMFMMNPMMSMMYNPMAYSSMYAPMMSPNVPSYFQQKYGSGPEDFSQRPFIKANPVGVMECYAFNPLNSNPNKKTSNTFRSFFA